MHVLLQRDELCECEWCGHDTPLLSYIHARRRAAVNLSRTQHRFVLFSVRLSVCCLFLPHHCLSLLSASVSLLERQRNRFSISRPVRARLRLCDVTDFACFGPDLAEIYVRPFPPDAWRGIFCCWLNYDGLSAGGACSRWVVPTVGEADVASAAGRLKSSPIPHKPASRRALCEPLQEG